jgi:hypothetical protein
MAVGPGLYLHPKGAVMRTFAAALVLASIAVATPSFSETWSPARIAKVKEQIAIQEGRAAALQPIVAGDITARDALLTNAAALDQIATDEAAQALEYRNMAATAPSRKTRAEFTDFAEKLETFANLSEKSATTHRELAQPLDESIQNMQDEVALHLEKAAAQKTALANNS